jgi:hypothetical protein
MDDRLVFDLVWDTAIHPSYLEHKKRCADEMHELVSGIRLCGVAERHPSGMFELLQYISSCILTPYGLSPKWEQPRVLSGEFCVPLRVRALDLAHTTSVTQ